MNELIFFFHTIVLIALVLIAFGMGPATLISLISVLAVLMNIFVIKQISLFGLSVTATDAFSVAIALGVNLIQEYYGGAAAQKAIYTSFFTTLILVLMSHVHLLYVPLASDRAHEHFVPIFSLIPRIIMASLASYLATMSVETWLYGMLKKRWPTASFLTRNYTTLLICQFLDTVLFSFLGLWGNVDHIEHIIFVSYSIKLLSLLIMTPIASVTRMVLPHEQRFTI